MPDELIFSQMQIIIGINIRRFFPKCWGSWHVIFQVAPLEKPWPQGMPLLFVAISIYCKHPSF